MKNDPGANDFKYYFKLKDCDCFMTLRVKLVFFFLSWQTISFFIFLFFKGRIKEEFSKSDPTTQTIAQLEYEDEKMRALNKSRKEVTDVFEQILKAYPDPHRNNTATKSDKARKIPIVANTSHYEEIVKVMPYLAGYLPLEQTMYLVTPKITWCFQDGDNVMYYKGMREPSFYINRGYLNHPKHIIIKPFYGQEVPELNEPIPENLFTVTKKPESKESPELIHKKNIKHIQYRHAKRFMNKVGFPYKYYRTFSARINKNPIASFGSTHISLLRIDNVNKVIADLDKRFFKKHISYKECRQFVDKILIENKINNHIFRSDNYLNCEDKISQKFSMFPMNVVNVKKATMPNPLLMTLTKTERKKKNEQLRTFVNFRKPKKLNFKIFNRLFGTILKKKFKQKINDVEIGSLLPTYELNLALPNFKIREIFRKETYIEPKLFLEPATPLIFRINPKRMKMDALIYQFRRIYYLYKYFVSAKKVEEGLAALAAKDAKGKIKKKVVKKFKKRELTDEETDKESYVKKKVDVKKKPGKNKATGTSKERKEPEKLPTAKEIFKNTDFVQYPEILKTKLKVFKAKQQVLNPLYVPNYDPNSPFPVLFR